MLRHHGTGAEILIKFKWNKFKRLKDSIDCYHVAEYDGLEPLENMARGEMHARAGDEHGMKTGAWSQIDGVF